MSRLLQLSNYISFFAPLFYSLIIGYAWALIFRQKFLNSLATSYMAHILLVLLSGLLFKKLSYGIILGLVLAIFALIFGLIKESKKDKAFIKNRLNEFQEDGLFIFLIFYIFCFFINFGKRFTEWDEFSHWGMFLKECIRLDCLYCMSPLEFAHKDYVPAFTLFETIWCKLSGGFSEPNAYRAIQMLTFSWIIPICEVKIKSSDASYSAKTKKKRIMLLAVISTYCILLLLNQPGTSFFHSIYVDLPMGVLLAWCIVEIYRMKDKRYLVVELMIGLTVLTLSKMIAIALLPLVLSLVFARFFIFKDNPEELQNKTKNNYANIIKNIVLLLLMGILPAIIWLWFNLFVHKWCHTIGNKQSYFGMMASSILEPFKAIGKSNIEYLGTLRHNYIHAIFYTKLLIIGGSYFLILLLIVIALMVFAVLTKNSYFKKKVCCLNAWIIASGLYYSVLMYYLYATAFTEYEAVRLASYDRYMESFLVTVVLIAIGVYFEHRIFSGEKQRNGLLTASFALMSYMFLFHISAFDTVFTGYISKDINTIWNEWQFANDIIQSCPDAQRIYLVSRGDTGWILVKEKYYCNPIIIGGGSIGPAIDENDIWSIDYSVEEFVDELNKYDYICFHKIDDDFKDKYSVAFNDAYTIENGDIYKVSELLK